MKTPTRREVIEKALQGIDIKELADRLGTGTKYVYGIKHGRQISWKQAIKFEEITAKMGRKIPRNVLRPDVFGNG